MLLIQKVAGEDFARDLQEFFGNMGDLAEALSSRAAGLGALLGRASTRYVVVTGPEESRVDDTLSMIELVRGRAYRPSAVIVNRVTPEAIAPDVVQTAFVAPGSFGADDHSVFSTLATKLDAQRSASLDRAARERVQISRLQSRIDSAIVRVVPPLAIAIRGVICVALIVCSAGIFTTATPSCAHAGRAMVWLCPNLSTHARVTVMVSVELMPSA